MDAMWWVRRCGGRGGAGGRADHLLHALHRRHVLVQVGRLVVLNPKCEPLACKGPRCGVLLLNLLSWSVCVSA